MGRLNRNFKKPLRNQGRTPYNTTEVGSNELHLLHYCGRLSSRYFILMQYKLKLLQFIPNAPSTFLWAMNDAHSPMIHSFESILFKGFIKPVGRPVNWFVNQFE